MSDGYTLAEALAAMLIIGLAAGGLSMSGLLFENQQRQIKRTLSAETSQVQAQRVLSDFASRLVPTAASPTPSLVGAEQSIEARCDSGPCQLQLSSSTAGAVLTARFADKTEEARLAPIAWHFRFFANDLISPAWPVPAVPSNLTAVGLFGADRAVAIGKIWRQESADCAFDAIVAKCRGAS